jgi:hypothetical protein
MYKYLIEFSVSVSTDFCQKVTPRVEDYDAAEEGYEGRTQEALQVGECQVLYPENRKYIYCIV